MGEGINGDGAVVDLGELAGEAAEAAGIDGGFAEEGAAVLEVEDDEGGGAEAALTEDGAEGGEQDLAIPGREAGEVAAGTDGGGVQEDEGVSAGGIRREAAPEGVIDGLYLECGERG